MGKVRITQLDGKLPNLALMKLSSWHRSRGDEVHFSRSPYRDLHEPQYDTVYGSAIFDFTAQRLARFQAEFPGAIIGGSGTGSTATVEAITRQWDGLDYSHYPDFKPSIGFTQRGCRFKCAFCGVPKKEGPAHAVGPVSSVWRGPGHPKKLHLLDNDFFGQPKAEWTARIAEIRDGGFRVCFNQGINIRVVTPEIAAALASVEYRDDAFKERRLYTAWDNLGDERLFFRGVDTLEGAGVPPQHIMAYMLVGFDPDETFDAILYRFQRMVARGIHPYPMVFDNTRRDLKRFQRWVVTGLYRAVPWAEYDPSRKASHRTPTEQGAFALEAA